MSFNMWPWIIAVAIAAFAVIGIIALHRARAAERPAKPATAGTAGGTAPAPPTPTAAAPAAPAPKVKLKPLIDAGTFWTLFWGAIVVALIVGEAFFNLPIHWRDHVPHNSDPAVRAAESVPGWMQKAVVSTPERPHCSHSSDAAEDVTIDSKEEITWFEIYEYCTMHLEDPDHPDDTAPQAAYDLWCESMNGAKVLSEKPCGPLTRAIGLALKKDDTAQARVIRISYQDNN